MDVGFVYLRPRLSLGYGRPFTQWIGVDANPIAAQNGLGAYAGLRLEIPHLDFRIGPRYFASFSHTYLPTRASYSRLELESNSGNPSRTLTFEAELDLNFDLGPGRLLLRGSASYVSGAGGLQRVRGNTAHHRRSAVGLARAFGVRVQLRCAKAT